MSTDERGDTTSWWQRAAWMVAIWTASVATLAAVAAVLRYCLRG